MKNLLKQWWKDHGTKILGFGSMVLGAVEMLDAHTIQIVQSTLGPRWGAIVSGALQIVAGFAVAQRGFLNSKKLNAHPSA